MVHSSSMLLATLCLTACQTIDSQVQPVAVSSEARTGRPVQAWEAVGGHGERLGLVVRFEATAREEVHFIVRNVWHQDLGLIDANGRAYRFRPHSPEPFWVGTGTVPEGVQRVLASEPCELFEVEFKEPDPARTPGERERRRATAFAAPAPSQGRSSAPQRGINQLSPPR